ncbi:MAG: winged helix-turn-helix domain-containing protein [Alphaproteobacteria bacterium]|nr:winged helix-turn-helix domain-containing protein [Alphaproteobacteria bacterium]
MGRKLEVAPHLTQAELDQRFFACRDPDERLRLQAVMLKMEGWSTENIARACRCRPDWVRRTVRKFNAGGPEALADGRRSNGAERRLSPEEMDRLDTALAVACPYGGFWSGPMVVKWCDDMLGVDISPDAARLYMKRLGYSRQTPRPKHPDADEEAQEAFKKGGFSALFEGSFETSRVRRFSSGPRTKDASD